MQHPYFTMNAQGCSDYTHEKLKVLQLHLLGVL